MYGSGVHTANLFMPVDFGDVEDVPIFDLFVNGQHFELSTSAYKTISVNPGGAPGGQCMSQIWIEESPDPDTIDRTVLPVPAPAGSYKTVFTPCPEVELSCVGETTVGPCANNPAYCASGACSDCSPTSMQTFWISDATAPLPCAKLYAIVNNHPSSENWCDAACPVACSVSAQPGCNLSPDERFDLDRNELDGLPGDAVVPAPQRARFTWQWFQVMGFRETEAVPPVTSLTAPFGSPVTFKGLLVGEGINLDDKKNISIDVDQDLKMEYVEAIYHIDNIIIGFDVQDGQDGDVDFSYDDRSQGLPPGFTKDVNIYTEVYDGTYLKIEEGKLFAGTQFIRTASKKDTIDIIERVFKLSNDTNRLCINGAPQMPAIESCGNCFAGDRITSTCFDPQTLFLFVRSRLTDYHGHKWITDLDNDPYVDFSP
jgi:hypothetical protein